jgi:HSP20 family protein
MPAADAPAWGHGNRNKLVELKNRRPELMANEQTLEKQTDEQASSERTRSGQFYRPNVDIVEQQDELMLMVDLPGVKPSEIDINFEDGELSIHGHVPPRYEEAQSFLLTEYGTGDFYRTFRVSEQIDSTKIHAAYNDGMLTLHLPKVEAMKARKIAVQV